MEDPYLVVAIYEGEHNHPHPCQPDVSLGFNQGHIIPGSISGPNATISSSPSSILDSTQSEAVTNAKRNHNFTTAVAAAISTRILDHDLSESWETTS